jgi:hypothetical protein
LAVLTVTVEKKAAIAREKLVRNLDAGMECLLVVYVS